MKFTFNSKETYLAYRKDWAVKYDELVLTVRKGKWGIREAMRAYSKGNGSAGGIWTAMCAKSAANAAVDAHVSELWDARKEAGRQTRARHETVA